MDDGDAERASEEAVLVGVAVGGDGRRAGPGKPGLPRAPLNAAVLPPGLLPAALDSQGESLSVIQHQSQT